MPPYRVEWLDEAKVDVRRLDRPTAMRIFDGILHYARTGGGDVAALHGDMAGSFACASEATVSCSVFTRTPCASSASVIAATLIDDPCWSKAEQVPTCRD